ncbi:zinc-finger homeodomain protein 11-like [Ananas comosus]|uniref:Zinc-finger homeodomain protein 11-like n=1 Tax=Ananas comosus TaxID=4615 RepID=A0A6P5GFE9_ANACO|nr:zinc-finger homeodomain protein 11-like [Ananas comosus]
MREIYRECLKNHAAKLGTYAADGCCEYISDEVQPGTLYCAACGCHRSFHRKGVAEHHTSGSDTTAVATKYLQLRGQRATEEDLREGGSKRRTRTRFTQEQKARMARFAGSIGWKMPRREGGAKPPREEGDDVDRFCCEVGVTRKSFKVWMHNHKGGGGGATVMDRNSPACKDSDEGENTNEEEGQGGDMIHSIDVGL